MTRELIIECMVCNEECQEENSCFECADKQLTEYEKQIRAEAIDSCKTVVMETIDNELLVDTLLMRMDKLNENNDG